MWSFSSLFSRSAPRPAEPEKQAASTRNIDEQVDTESQDADKTTISESTLSEAESPQTTSKATAMTTPALPVPEISLDDGSSNGTSASNGLCSSSTKPTASAMPAPPLPKSANGSSLMTPPPPRPPTLPQHQARQPPRPASSAPGQFLVPPKPKASVPLRPPPSAASFLRTPPNRLTSSTLAPAQRAGSRKVILEPGHSPLDWAVLSSDPKNNLRGADVPAGLIRVTPSMLKVHHGRKGMDAWTSYNGKVYNITPYLPFHPGGKGELMRGAGKDSGKLFLEIHPWVNWDGMLGECLVGILVSENEALAVNDLDTMD